MPGNKILVHFGGIPDYPLTNTCRYVGNAVIPGTVGLCQTIAWWKETQHPSSLYWSVVMGPLPVLEESHNLSERGREMLGFRD